MLAICYESGSSSFWYSWDCGDGCCSNTDCRDHWVEKGKIYDLGDSYHPDRIPYLLARLPDDAMVGADFYLDSDGWLSSQPPE